MGRQRAPAAATTPRTPGSPPTRGRSAADKSAPRQACGYGPIECAGSTRGPNGWTCAAQSGTCNEWVTSVSASEREPVTAKRGPARLPWRPPERPVGRPPRWRSHRNDRPCEVRSGYLLLVPQGLAGGVSLQGSRDGAVGCRRGRNVKERRACNRHVKLHARELLVQLVDDVRSRHGAGVDHVGFDVKLGR